MENEFPINQIMQRYSLPVDKNLLYSYEELKRLDINQDFIYTLLQTFEDEKAFSEKEYQRFSLDVIIDYIHRTHHYYLSKKLCEIEQNIHILLKDYSDHHPLLTILNNFFREYTTGLTAHIKAEEKFLLPYIKCLLQFEKDGTDAERYYLTTKDYSLQMFIDTHHDTEKDLMDVRNIILNYQPPVTNHTPYRVLLTQLQVFEKDMSVHALIEDRVLIPRAMQLENKLNNYFKEKTKLN